MTKWYDEIRFFFNIVTFITQELFLEYYVNDIGLTIIITTYRRISISYKQQANIRRSHLVFTRESVFILKSSFIFSQAIFAIVFIVYAHFTTQQCPFNLCVAPEKLCLKHIKMKSPNQKMIQDM